MKISEKFESWVVLTISCLNLIGIYYCYNIPQPLQTVLTTEYGLSNKQFISLFAAYNFPNIFLTGLIGFLAAKYGEYTCFRYVIVLSVVGQILFTYSCIYFKYILMVVGRVIFGFGGDTSLIMLSSIVSKFFKGKQESLSLAILYASTNIGILICSSISPIIYNASQSIKIPVLVSCILLVFTSILSCILFLIKKQKNNKEEDSVSNQKKLKISIEKQQQQQQQDNQKEKYNNWVFFCVLAKSFIFYLVHATFIDTGNDFLVETFQFDNEKAGINIGILLGIFCVLSPLIGHLQDVYNQKIKFCILGNISCLAGFLFAYFLPRSPQYNTYNVILLMTFYCLFHSIVSPSIISSISLVVSINNLNQAYGLYGIFSCLGVTIGSVICGFLLDIYGIVGYDYLLLMYSALQIVALIICFIMSWCDSKAYNKLQYNTNSDIPPQLQKYQASLLQDQDQTQK